ncbi:hypothetical protein DH2020_003981 [Rehmannia glutinosa]|uniref:RNase H type-1 domain-containing protein n=1 Tax=Rehmannia glutinosa TaxID=99300 RepID=A0ABR0XN77_REHGL
MNLKSQPLSSWSSRGVVRDSGGKVILAFGRNVELMRSAFEGELLALKDGLIRVKEMDVRHQLVISDSLLAVQAVMATHEDLSYNDALLQDIYHFQADLGVTKFTHKCRTANSVAHRLAFFSAFSSSSFCWTSEDLPSWIEEIVLADISL